MVIIVTAELQRVKEHCYITICLISLTLYVLRYRLKFLTVAMSSKNLGS
jgi:hypothetical protein